MIILTRSQETLVNNLSRRRLIVFGLIVLAAIVGVWFGLRYIRSFQNITIEPPAHASIKLYKHDPVSDGPTYKANDLVVDTATKISKKLKKGAYVFVVTPSSPDYDGLTESLLVGDTAVSLRPSIKLSTQKLVSIAVQETPNIQKVLVEKYPVAMARYQVQKVVALQDGSWFGARLGTNNPADDVMVVVLHKTNESLSVASDPPSIILSKPVFPDIPGEVIDAVNNLGFK
jgi:hypothetical protein